MFISPNLPKEMVEASISKIFIILQVFFVNNKSLPIGTKKCHKVFFRNKKHRSQLVSSWRLCMVDQLVLLCIFLGVHRSTILGYYFLIIMLRKIGTKLEINVSDY